MSQGNCPNTASNTALSFLISTIAPAVVPIAIAICVCTPRLAAAQEFGPSNPFYAPSPLPFHAPPFDKIKDEDYQPAIEAGIAQSEAEYKAIAENPDPPTFDNTIVAMEKTGLLLDRASSAFFGVAGANIDDTIQKVRGIVAPKLAALEDSLTLRRDREGELRVGPMEKGTKVRLPDNSLVRVFGNEGAEIDITRFGERFGCVVVDSYGSTEGGATVQRTPDTPASCVRGQTGPLGKKKGFRSVAFRKANFLCFNFLPSAKELGSRDRSQHSPSRIHPSWVYGFRAILRNVRRE